MSKALGKGESIIENGNMRTAYKKAVEEALMDAVREYYGNNSDNETEIPDITPEYVKFIKSYKITARNTDGYKIDVGVEASLDTVSLKDASRLLNRRLDTAVFAFTPIPGTGLAYSEISKIINNTLQSKNFSTMDQNTFAYVITDPNDTAGIIGAFGGVNSKYLFKFDFEAVFPEEVEGGNLCELTATTDIRIKRGEAKALKVETSSQNPNKKECFTEALTQAVSSTIDYVRANIIQEQSENSHVYSYEIKTINFKNMVSTNKFLIGLRQKGLVNSFRGISFASKENLFSVESLFDKETLVEKIKETGLDKNVGIAIGDKGLILDFNPY